MAFGQEPVCSQVPNADGGDAGSRRIVCRRFNAPAIGGERERRYRRAWPLENPSRLSRLPVPQQNAGVLRDGQEFGVGGEGGPERPSHC